MTLVELKATAAQLGITADEVRTHGKLTAKATWQAAIDAAQTAQQPAQETAQTVTDVLYSDTSRAITQWLATAILLIVFTLGLIAVRLTQATWQATAPLRQRASHRIHSEVWAAVGAWPELLIGL